MRRCLIVLCCLAIPISAGCDDGAGGRPDGPPPVLLVGIDGATFDVIDPLLAAGRLPNLASLIERGWRAPLATIEPTVSPAIWTTIATGRRPEEHGILGFEGVPGQSMQGLPTTGMRRVRAFWNILDEADQTSGVVGWWVTYPAEPVEGYVVSDRVAYTRMEATIDGEEPRDDEIHPPSIVDRVRARVRSPGELSGDDLRRLLPLEADQLSPLFRQDYHHGALGPELRYVFQSDRSTVDIATDLMTTLPVDVAAVGLYGVDLVSHLAWHLRDPESFPGYRIRPADVERYGGLIDAYYVYVDEELGRLLDAHGSDGDVIVFSDHGFGPTGYLPWSGGHGRITPGAPVAPDGILVMAGPSFRHGRGSTAHVLDLAPTLLGLRGLAAAVDMPGEVLTEPMVQAARARVPTERIPTYETEPLPYQERLRNADPEVDQELMRKLESLGYLGTGSDDGG